MRKYVHVQAIVHYYALIHCTYHRLLCDANPLYHIKIRKAIELCEQLRQRMGVVIVGPSGSGKTTLWQLLKAALQKLGTSIKSYTMNPKAMPRTQVIWHAAITNVSIVHMCGSV